MPVLTPGKVLTGKGQKRWKHLLLWRQNLDITEVMGFYQIPLLWENILSLLLCVSGDLVAYTASSAPQW